MDDINNTKKNNDSYNFLLLALYFYLKKNNFNETSEKIFNECKLDSIFKFPQDLKNPKTEKEKLTNQFIEFFYSNSFKNDSNFDLLGDFWNQFWRIFANKMNMGNNLNIETLFEKEQKNISKISYIQKNLSSNFNNNNNIASYSNNIDNLKTINNLTNISKNTNNNINTEDIINIINTSNEHLNTNMNNMNNINNINNMNNINNYSSEKKEKNIVGNKVNINNNENIFENNNFIRNNSNMNKNIGEKYNKSNIQINKSQIYDDEEEEEEINDIEREMDEINGITFNNKNSSSIIKRTNGEEMPLGMYPNDHYNDIGKNLYQGFPPNNSSSNFNLNLIGNQNNKMERNMSAIPLRKDVALENNNQEFEI